MKNLILLLMITFFAASCQHTKQQQTDLPPINREKMVEIMADCFILEGVIYYEQIDSLQRKTTVEKYSQLFDYYEVTVEEWQQSVNFYLQDKEESKFFLDEVNAKIIQKRDSIFAIN